MSEEYKDLYTPNPTTVEFMTTGLVAPSGPGGGYAVSPEFRAKVMGETEGPDGVLRLESIVDKPYMDEGMAKDTHRSGTLPKPQIIRVVSVSEE